MKNSVVLFLLLLSLVAVGTSPVHAQSQYQLHIEVQPATIPADGGKYPIYVMLIGPENTVTKAPKDILVNLFTSDPRILEVPQSLVIKKDEYFAKTYVKTSTVIGQVTITAAAEGVEKGEVSVEVVHPLGQPVKLAVYTRPTTILPYPDEKATVIVRLEDGLGHPVKAPRDIRVRLTLSDTDLGKLAEEAVIPEGLYQTELTFVPKGLVGLVTITASAVGYEEGMAVLTIKAPQPVALKLYAAPESIPADGTSYGYLAITLVDEAGYPAPSEHDVKVFLSSSNDAIITLETNMTVIPKGKYYTLVKFFSTGINGTSQLTAHAEDLMPDSIEVGAVQLGEHSMPNKINLFVIPNILLPDESLHKGIVVLQMVNATGQPIIMHQDVTFTLSSSDPRFGNVSRFITVPGGSNIGLGNFTTGHVSGSTKLTATADGFETGYFDVEIKTRPPTSLKLEMAPPIIRADGQEYNVFVVQLLDDSGNPTKAVNDTTVYLLPSDTTLIKLPPQVVIPVGKSSAEFSARTTVNHGELTIYAHSHNLEPASLSVNIEEPYPSDIRMALEPPYGIADGGSVDLILWVEGSGVPAKLDRPVNISLFTTNSSIAKPKDWILHMPNASYTISQIELGKIVGWTNILAVADGFKSFQIPFYTVLLPMSVEFNTSAKFVVGEPSPISLWVHYFDYGIPNAYVEFHAENGTILTKTFLTDEDGWLTFNYVPKVYGTNKIEVTVQAVGYEEGYGSIEVSATAYPQLKVSLVGINGVPISGVQISVVMPNGTVLTQKTDQAGTVTFSHLEAGNYTVSVPTESAVSDKEMFSFSSWQDGVSNAVRTISLIEDTQLVAQYVKKYLVLVNSIYGTTKGTGWYEEGAMATISISPVTVQISPLAPPQKFTEWSGDIHSTNPTTSFIVDSPKVIIAKWTPDYVTFAINITPIIAVVLVIASLPILIRRRVKKKEEEIEEEFF